MVARPTIGHSSDHSPCHLVTLSPCHRQGGRPVTARWLLVPSALVFAALLRADGPADNQPDKVRPIPPPGIAVPDKDRKEIQAGLDDLGKDIEALRKDLHGKPALLELLPDIEIFPKAVRY